VNPRLASPRLERDTDGSHGVDDVARWRWFAVALFAAGIGAGVVLLASGARLSGFAALVVLTVLLALAVNRYAFFPSELAVTAEVGVLVAAVVGFGIPAASGAAGGGDAALAPWFLALLAGPLDLLHWRQRSYVRMAYNAGNRMAATLLASVAFAAVVGGDRSPSFVRIAIGGLAASAAFALVEVVVGTVLVRLRSRTTWLAAGRVELPMESLTVPLGAVGALAGYLGASVGWWVAPLLLAPTIAVPELVLVARRPRRAHLRAVVMVVVATGALVLPAVLTGTPGPPEIAGLAVVAVLLGLELRPDTGTPVPALVALGVSAALVVGMGAELSGAVGVAVVATTVTWGLERKARWWAVLLAAGAAVASDVVFDLRPSRAAALVAALVFQLVVWTRVERVLWTVPLVCLGVSSAFLWRTVGDGGIAVFVVVFIVVLAAVVAVGAAPWASRIVAAWAVGRRIRVLPVVAAAAAAALACAVVGVAAGTPNDVLVPVAATCAGGVAAIAMNAVRQWRFAPTRRAAEAGAVLVAAVAVATWYPLGGLERRGWSVALLALALVVCTTVAWPLVRRASDATARPSRTRAEHADAHAVSAGPGASGRRTRRSPPRS
jgi:hypothetical protein